MCDPGREMVGNDLRLSLEMERSEWTQNSGVSLLFYKSTELLKSVNNILYIQYVQCDLLKYVVIV